MSPPPRRASEEQAVLQMQPRIHLGPSAAPSQIFPELFSSRLLLPRSLKKIGHSVSGHKKLTADKNSIENGLSVSIKLPHLSYGQPKKPMIFGRLRMADYVNTCLQNLQCNPTLSPPSPQNRKESFLLPPTCPNPLNLSNPPLNHPGSEDGSPRTRVFSHLPSLGVNAHSPEYLPSPNLFSYTPLFPHRLQDLTLPSPLPHFPDAPSRELKPPVRKSDLQSLTPKAPPSRGRGPPARLTSTGGAAALRPQGGAGSRAPAAATGRRGLGHGG